MQMSLKGRARRRGWGRSCFRTEVEIERPIEAVFEVISDPRFHARWWPRVRSCTRTDGEGCEVGASFVLVQRPFAVAPAVRFQTEVLARVPPAAVAIREESRVAIVRVIYELEPAPGGTRLVRTEHASWKLPVPFPRRAERMVRGRREHRLRVLKFFLERVGGNFSSAGQR